MNKQITQSSYVYLDEYRASKSTMQLVSSVIKNKLLSVMMVSLISSIALAQTVVVNPTSPFTVPLGVTSLKVEVWGGGGGGGGAVGSLFAARGAGGGGGGAYKTQTLSVTSGQIYTITYGAGGSGGATTPTNGANGGATIFTGSAGTVSANGGSGGLAANGANSNGGAGGTGGTFNGGAGGNSSGNGAGGGGGAGNNGSGGAGGNAVTGAAGTGLPNVVPYIGGIGGAFKSGNGNGNNAGSPGGGGGGGKGASLFGTATGGNGGAGQVVLTYTLPPCTTPPVGGTASGPSTACVASVATYSVSGSTGSITWQTATVIGGPYTDVIGANASTFNYTPVTSGNVYVRAKLQSAGCTDAFSTIISTSVSVSPNTPTTPSGFSVCPGDNGTISVSNSTTLSTTLTFSIPSQPAETNSAPGNIISSATMPALPPGATVTNAILTLNNITALSSSWMSDVRLGFSGAVTNTAAAGTGTANTAGNFNYSRSFTSTINAAGGTVNLLYWDYVDDNTGIEANFNSPTTATLTISYTLPVSIQWYDASSGGNLVGTGTPFNPVGTSVLPNTNTAGNYSFYAQSVIGGCVSPARLSVLVNIKEPPSVTVSTPTSVCTGLPLSLTADNTASGQTSGNSYAWSGPGFSSALQNPTVTTSASAGTHAGNYIVTITNQFLCSASAIVNVVVNANPTLVMGTQTNITCNGDNDGSVSVSASGGTTPYLFYDGSSFIPDNSGALFTSYSPGTYCFTVIDNNGCDNSLAAPICATITQPDVLAFTTTPVGEDCPGNANGSITVNATGGTAGYLYSNNNGGSYQASTNFSSLATGVYDIVVKDAHNCLTASSPVTISTQYNLSIAPSSVTTNDDNNEICSGNTITLTQVGGNLSTAPGTVYKWYSNSCNGTLLGTGTSITVSPSAATSYYVLADGICNVTACANTSVAVSTSSPTHSVAMPINNLPVNACNGSMVSNIHINTVNLATQYIWDGPTGCVFNGSGNPFTSSTPAADIVFGNPNGSGYYIGVQAANGCGATQRKVQWVRGTVSVPAAITGSTTTCESTVGTYSTGAITGASSYLWTITGDATVSGNGTTVTVNFGPSWNGGTLCVAAQTSCYTSATKCIYISRAASIITQINGTVTACPGQTETYFVAPVNGAAQYFWTLPPGASGSSSTNSINVSFGSSFIGGNISVSVVSICGVPSPVKSKTINNGSPPVPSSVSGPLTGLCQQTIIYTCPSQPGVNYTWSVPASATINSGQGTNAISSTFGTFNTSSVCVTASNSCGSSAARCITVTGRPNTPGAISSIPGSWCANTSGVEFNVDVSLLTGSYTLSWLYPSSPVANYLLGGGNSTSLILNWNNGNGQVQVTASNACGGQTRTSIQGNSCREDDGMQNTASTTQISVFPNPASTVLNIGLPHNMVSQVKLIDIAGRTVLANDCLGQQNILLDVSKLVPGMYLLETIGNASEKIKINITR